MKTENVPLTATDMVEQSAVCAVQPKPRRLFVL